MSNKNILFLGLLFVTLVWGSTFALVKSALDCMGPFYFLAVRFSLASIIMLFIFRKSFLTHKIKPGYILVGIFLFLGYVFQTIGLKYTTASNAAFITGLSVVIVPFLEIIFMKRRLPLTSILGAISSTVGLWFLTGLHSFNMNYGDLLVLICALCFASQIITVGICAPNSDTGVISTTQVIMVAILSWFSIPVFRETINTNISTTAIWAVVITAIFATALAFYIQALAQKVINPTTIALIFATEPVFGGLFGYFILKEVLTPSALFGAGLILLGMFVTQIPKGEKDR
ncbi:MAG: DMT family transporter [bacterium]|nr:DMT family transporter [bacterium]